MSSVLKLIFNQTENFHNKVKFLSNYKEFEYYKFVIISLTHFKQGSWCIFSIDRFGFWGDNKPFTKVSSKGKTCWGKKGFIGTKCFKVKCLIENCFFLVGNIMLKQCIGIPMAIDPVKVWANLFLDLYENQIMTEFVSNNEAKARYFQYTKRFTDAFV